MSIDNSAGLELQTGLGPSSAAADPLERLLRQLDELIARALPLYSGRWYPYLAADKLEAYLALLDAYPREGPYDHVGTEVAIQALLVKHRYGQQGLLRFHGAVLLALMQRNTPVLVDAGLPHDVKVWGLENFCRLAEILIAGEASDEESDNHQPPAYLAYPSDRFMKDLSAATLRLMVCGDRKLCRVKAPRGLLKSHPLSMSAYALRHGLGGAYLETHFDSNDVNLRARFGESSWRQTLLNAARMMRDDPGIAGLLEHSWYYDPALEKLAPGLAYIRTEIVQRGGSLFCTGPSPDTTESALRGSTVRQGLHELGLYSPTRFKAVWPRRAALRWLTVQ